MSAGCVVFQDCIGDRADKILTSTPRCNAEDFFDKAWQTCLPKLAAQTSKEGTTYYTWSLRSSTNIEAGNLFSDVLFCTLFCKLYGWYAEFLCMFESKYESIDMLSFSDVRRFSIARYVWLKEVSIIHDLFTPNYLNTQHKYLRCAFLLLVYLNAVKIMSERWLYDRFIWEPATVRFHGCSFMHEPSTLGTLPFKNILW